jgi:adenylate cyclase
MGTMKKLLKRILGGWGIAAGALFTTAVGGLLYDVEVARDVVYTSYNLLFPQRAPVAIEDVVMIYMDDDSHDRLGQRLDAAWDRRLHTQLIKRLTRAGTRAVVFDVVFSDPSREPEVDEAFSKALLANGAVVLAADNVPAGYGVDLANIKKVTLPTEKLLDAAAQVGSAELKPSPDLVVRLHHHGANEDLLTSMSWATATLLGAEVTKREEDRFQQRWFNYYGPDGTLPSVSYWRALDTNLTSDAMFRGKVIFIGARLFTKFAGERKDEFRSPYWHLTPDRPFISGVEVQATQYLNLMRGDWLGRWPASLERAILIVFGLLLGGTLVLLRPRVAVATTIVATVLILGLSNYGFTQRNGWFPWLIPILQAFMGMIFATVFNSLRLYVQNRLLEQSLSLHLSPSRVKQLIHRPELLRPGAEKHELSIMFSDIADFTKFSEGMDSDDLAHMMNSYFESAISAVHESDGTVVKLIGDAIFAVWNAPIEQSDHRIRACRAALKLSHQPVTFQTAKKEVVLFTRIGLHTGVANVGNFGSATRFDYTALGENINLASRMEGLNKYLGTQVLLTGDTYPATKDHFVTRPLGTFQLKGFEKPVDVYELVGLPEQAEVSREWRELFAKALALYKEQDLTTAQVLFQQVLHLRPDDGPSKFYLGKIKELEADLLSMNIEGHTQMVRMLDK